MASVTERLSDAIEPRAKAIQASLGAQERTPRMAVVIGRILGIGMLVALITGIYSHLLQNPLPWLTLPTRPVELYQWSQGIHVIAGFALLPLLLAKLWIVYPRLFDWPPIRSLTGVLERGSIAILVSASLLQVVMGTLNTFQWYPWQFSFRATHGALAWVIVGAMVIHIAVKLPLIAQVWRREPEAPNETEDADG